MYYQNYQNKMRIDYDMVNPVTCMKGIVAKNIKIKFKIFKILKIRSIKEKKTFNDLFIIIF